LHNHFSKEKAEAEALMVEAEALMVEAEALKNVSASASLITNLENKDNNGRKVLA
jgi:hypothetical protein